MSNRCIRRCSSIFTDPSNVLAVHELRSRLLQDKTLAKYSTDDIIRIRDEDWWLNCFLHSVRHDVDIAYAIMLECLKWRHNYDIEHISLLTLKPMLDRQLMYLHGNDLKNRTILWVKFNMYRNGDVGFEQLFIFWMERHFMESKGAQMTLFLDMLSTGLKNMSFDVMKFIIHASRYYYPNAIDTILVFESPSILNASWKVIKSWLEPQNGEIVFVTRESVTHYVSKENLLSHHGGSDNFIFTMDELAKCLPPPVPAKPKLQTMHSIDDNANEKFTNDLSDFPNRRNVKFDEEDPTRKVPLSMSRRSSRGPGGRRIPIPVALKPVIESKTNAPPDDWATNEILSVNPKDELCLDKIEGESDFFDAVIVKNTSSTNLLFKFKTTSPEKFRVRPSSGVIAPNGIETIRVNLQYEYRHSLSKEKFLLLAVRTSSTDLEKFSELYKNAEDDCKCEQKLRCKLAEHLVLDLPEERRSSFLINQDASNLKNQTATLQNHQRLTVIVVAFLFVMQIIAMLYERSNYQALKLIIEEIAQQQKSLRQDNVKLGTKDEL